MKTIICKTPQQALKILRSYGVQSKVITLPFTFDNTKGYRYLVTIYDNQKLVNYSI